MPNVKLCTEYLEQGMILGKDVHGADGSVLVAQGTVLGRLSMAALAKAGVDTVVVRHDGPLDEAEWLKAMSVSHARQFFQYVDPDSPFYNELFKICAERIYAAARGGAELPCAGDLAARTVEHLTDVFYRSDLRLDDLVLHETELTSFPDIYFRLKELLDNPASTMKEIAQVVSSDVALAGKVLRLVNSPLFGLASRVESVERAVSMVGARELSTLALGISAMNCFKDIPPELIDMQTFWRHSLSCGIFCKIVSDSAGLPAERMFIAGLLHDVGRLVLFKDLPYASVQALIFARSNFIPLLEAEAEIFGFSHAEVGARLLKAWSFPESLVELVAGHHASLSDEAGRGAAIVQLSDILSNAAAICSGSKFVLPQMSEAAIAGTGVDPARIAKLMEAHDAVFEDLSKSLL